MRLLFPFNGTMLSGCCIFYNYHFSVQFTFFKNILYGVREGGRAINLYYIIHPVFYYLFSSQEYWCAFYVILIVYSFK